VVHLQTPLSALGERWAVFLELVRGGAGGGGWGRGGTEGSDGGKTAAARTHVGLGLQRRLPLPRRAAPRPQRHWKPTKQKVGGMQPHRGRSLLRSRG
jgi:hypothetical protein